MANVGKVEMGHKWAHMECISIEIRNREYLNFGIKEIGPEDWYVFRCECGRTKETWASDWTGKRKNKDCGCGVSNNDGLSVLVHLTMPVNLRHQVGEYMKAQNCGFSFAVQKLIRAGLESKVNEIAGK